MTTFLVNVANDPGTAHDGTTGVTGTLSWAVAQVNANGSANNVIDIETDVNLAGPLSPIFNSVIINGNGHTIDAGGHTRIFMVGVDTATEINGNFTGTIIGQTQNVAINGVTLANGLARGGSGSGGGMGAGGALFVNQSAHVTLTDVVFSHDQAIGGAGDPSLGGGGGLGGNGGASTRGGGGGIFGDGGESAGVTLGPGGGGLFGNGGSTSFFSSGGGGGGYSGDGGNAVGNDGAAGTLLIAGVTGSGAHGSGSGSGAGGGSGGGGGAGDYSGEGGGGGFGGLNSAAGFGGGGGGTGGHGNFGGGGGTLGDGGFGGGGGGQGTSGYGGGSAFKGTAGFGGGGGESGGQPGFGGGSGENGGGAGMGGAIFVVKGGQLTINGNGTESGGSVTGGAPGSAFGAVGSTFGSGLFVQGSTLTFGGSGTYTIADVIADENGSGGFGAPDGFGATGGVTSITKNDAGALILMGADTYAGDTTVNGGTLTVDGSIANSPAIVNAGGTLAGTGILGHVSVASGGTLAPGDGPGILHADSVTLAAGAHFAVAIGGTSASAGGYDQLAASAAVNLTGATLDVSFLNGFHPTIGEKFAIIDAVDPVTGTFAGLSEGTKFHVGGSAFTISYHGGAGNDVVLTAVMPGNVIVIAKPGNHLINATHTVAGQPLPTNFGDLIICRRGNDTVHGGAGNDTIVAGPGDDHLFGGPGDNTFVFRTAHGDAHIGDFKHHHDTLEFAKSVFKSAGHLHYDAMTGALLFNPGSGGWQHAVQFATLAPHLHVTGHDFLFA